MSRFSSIVLILCMLAATAVLCGLGFWQVQRLAQKEALIAKVSQRLKSPEVPLADVEAMLSRGEDIEYFPVVVSGRFDHSREQYFFATLDGRSGWNVYAPLVLADGRTLLVNRGFVPMDRRDPATRTDGQVEGEQRFSGLARLAPGAKPNSFIPENAPQKREFFWKSLGEMALAAGLEPDALVPFFVDAGPSPAKGLLPIGGTTIVEFPNSHLQYAFTWFGLAAACLGVGGFFLYSRRVPA